MAFRLGHRMVKIWKWLKRSRKSRGYASLLMQDRRNRKIKRRLAMGGRSFPKFQALDSFDNGGESCERHLLHSPQNRAKENRLVRQFHLPHLELQRLKIFQWHFHLPHIGYGHGERNSPKHVPKGSLAVYVGQDEEEPHRFVIPAVYFNHPLFGDLLKDAEEQYGFEQKGPLNIPCHVSDFENVKRQISTECSQKHQVKHLREPYA